MNAKFMAVLEESMKNWGYSACPAEAIKTTVPKEKEKEKKEGTKEEKKEEKKKG